MSLRPRCRRRAATGAGSPPQTPHPPSRGRERTPTTVLPNAQRVGNETVPFLCRLLHRRGGRRTNGGRYSQVMVEQQAPRYRATFVRLLGFLRPYRWSMAISVVLAIG